MSAFIHLKKLRTDYIYLVFRKFFVVILSCQKPWTFKVPQNYKEIEL
jgi:hypothetical protein